MLTLEHRTRSEAGKPSKWFKCCHMRGSRECCGEVRDEATSREGGYQGQLLDRVASNLLSPRPSLPSQVPGLLPRRSYNTKLNGEGALLRVGQGGPSDLRICCPLAFAACVLQPRLPGEACVCWKGLLTVCEKWYER